MNITQKLSVGFIAAAALGVAGCTDASWDKMTKMGDSAHVKCYSGGMLIYDGVSTGQVQSEHQSDGYYFRDQADGKLKEVSGDCIITYSVDTPKP